MRPSAPAGSEGQQLQAITPRATACTVAASPHPQLTPLKGCSSARGCLWQPQKQTAPSATLRPRQRAPCIAATSSTRRAAPGGERATGRAEGPLYPRCQLHGAQGRLWWRRIDQLRPQAEQGSLCPPSATAQPGCDCSRGKGLKGLVACQRVGVVEGEEQASGAADPRRPLPCTQDTELLHVRLIGQAQVLAASRQRVSALRQSVLRRSPRRPSARRRRGRRRR